MGAMWRLQNNMVVQLLIYCLIASNWCFVRSIGSILDDNPLPLSEDCELRINGDFDDGEPQILPHWCHEELAVELNNCDNDKADQLAELYGYKNLGQIGSLENHYIFRHTQTHLRVRRDAHVSLNQHPDVRWSEGQKVKRRVKRDYHDVQGSSWTATQLQLPWSDPMYSDQWYLVSGASGGWDMRVREAWRLGYSGKNVSVSILDDGIQRDHPDLEKNYDPLASTDLNSNDDDPMPRNNGDNKHGTRCAGEVAAVAGNALCGVGVAYNAGIGGVRMLDGGVTDGIEAKSLAHNQHHVDIYSASWGPEDDGRTVDGPGVLARRAFYRGITKGRDKKGNIFVWASGNGGGQKDSCSCDGYTTSIYTLSVSSASMNNYKPWYLEQCPSTLATTYSSGTYNEKSIITTDMPNTCTYGHTGTSASAPLAAAMVALALEANPALTWRDMQHIVLRSSNPIPLEAIDGWKTNGVNRRVSHKFGYGLMDAEKLVILARAWTTVPEQNICVFKYPFNETNQLIEEPSSKSYYMTVGDCTACESVKYLEHVHSEITMKYPIRGDINITLTSPSGTTSVLLPPRYNDRSRAGFNKWPFLTVHSWGEDPRGTWKLTVAIKDQSYYSTQGTPRTALITQWDLVLYGTAKPTQLGDIEYLQSSPHRTNDTVSCGPLPPPFLEDSNEWKKSSHHRTKPGYKHIDDARRKMEHHFSFIWAFSLGSAVLLFVFVFAWFIVYKMKKKKRRIDRNQSQEMAVGFHASNNDSVPASAMVAVKEPEQISQTVTTGKTAKKIEPKVKIQDASTVKNTSGVLE